MSKIQLLSEHITPNVAMLKEQRVGGDLYLSGICMQAECVNGNRRTYRLDEMTREVNRAAKQIADGNFVLGELNHPDVLSINLANVAIAMTEIKMSGNNALAKMKVLNTPSGAITKALIEGGVRLGVSSRGAGSVNESGIVSGFDFVCCDVVSNPSAPDAYPNPIYESLQSSRIVSLAESVVHDPTAQASLKKEINAFLYALKLLK